MIRLCLVSGLILLTAPAAEARVVPAAASVRLLDGALVPAVASQPWLGLLDEGGGAPRRIRYDRDKLVPILLAIVPGFGLGHWWANDDAGFLTFLVVDAAVWAAFTIGRIVAFPLEPLLWAVAVVAKVWQVYDIVRVTGLVRGGGSDGPDGWRRCPVGDPPALASLPPAITAPALRIHF